MTVPELIMTLMEAHEDRQLMRLRNRLSKLDLDELGYVPASKVSAEPPFDVISTAYERTSIIVTPNLPFENWTEVGSERLTGAVLDRLNHRCHARGELSTEGCQAMSKERTRGVQPDPGMAL